MQEKRSMNQGLVRMNTSSITRKVKKKKKKKKTMKLIKVACKLMTGAMLMKRQVAVIIMLMIEIPVMMRRMMRDHQTDINKQEKERHQMQRQQQKG